MKVKDKHELLPPERRRLNVSVHEDGSVRLMALFYQHPVNASGGGWIEGIPLSLDDLVKFVGELDIEDD